MVYISMEHATELHDEFLLKYLRLEQVKLNEASKNEYKVIAKQLHVRKNGHYKIGFFGHRRKMAYSKASPLEDGVRENPNIIYVYAVGQGVVVHPRPLCWQHHAFLSRAQQRHDSHLCPDQQHGS